MRRVGTGRQRQGHDRSARQHLRRPAQSRLPDAAAAQHRLHRPDDRRRRAASGWHPFPGPASINSRTYQGRSACMYHGFCNKGGCHVDAKNGPHLTTIPRAQETGPLESRDARARHVDRRRCQRPRHRRDLRDRRPGIHPAREGRAARQLHLREHAPAAAVEVEGVSERAVEQPRPGRPPLPEPRARRRRHGAVPVQHQRLVRPARAGRRASTTSPTTTSITARSTTSAAATCG